MPSWCLQMDQLVFHNQWDPNEPLFSHIASHGTVLWAFLCQKCSRFPPGFGHQRPKTKNRPYLGLRGSKRRFKSTYTSRNPPLFAVSTPLNRPNRRRDPHTSADYAAGRCERAQSGGCPNRSTGSTGTTTPPIRRRNPNNSAGQFGGPIFRRTASQSPGLWPWPPKHTVPLVAVLSETCGNPCKLKFFLHRAASIRRKMTTAERK